MDKQKSLYYFEEAPVSKAIAHFSLPMMVTMLVGIVYNLVDTAFVGMMHDTNALAAVVLSMPVFLITNGIGQVFGIGCGSYISRLLAARITMLKEKLSMDASPPPSRIEKYCRVGSMVFSDVPSKRSIGLRNIHPSAIAAAPAMAAP